MLRNQAHGLGAAREEAKQRPRLSFWSEVAGLGPEELRNVRSLLESDLGDSFMLVQGVSPEAIGGVALVPVWEGSDQAVFALVHRIRESVEQGRAPRRLLFVAAGPSASQLPKLQTLSWVRQSLENSLDSAPCFVGFSRAGKKRPAPQQGLDKNLRSLEGLSKLLLDWISGEERIEREPSEEREKTLLDEVFEILSEQWGLLVAPEPQTFPRDHQFQEEGLPGASALGGKSEKWEAGSFKTARIDVSAGNRIGGIRE